MYSFKLLSPSEMPAIIPFLKLLTQDSTDEILESRLKEMFSQEFLDSIIRKRFIQILTLNV